MDFLSIIIGTVVGIVLGVFGLVMAKKISEGNKRRRSRSEADRILSKANREAQNIERNAEKKAKELESKIKKESENQVRKQKEQLKNKERALTDKEKSLERKAKDREQGVDQKLKQLEMRNKEIENLENKLKDKTKNIEEKVVELNKKLETASNMSADQARSDLIESVESQTRMEAAQISNDIEQKAKEDAEKEAKRIISMAINRYSGEYVTERAVGVIALTSEEMKGRIIGKEGRNIRALEAACGVDLIIDETPEAVVISSFDPVRREIAKRTLGVLMEDGRVHPARIEEVVDKTKSNIFRTIKEDGEKAMFDLGIHGVHKEIVNLVGSLKYRLSYTQNNWSHSIETGFLCGMMAAELGQNVKDARRAGVLHDIGKALDHSVEGSHAVIGADFAKRHGEKEHICHAIRSHHDDEKPRTWLAHLVTASDALSGARPGARKQSMENYVQRLEDLESIGNSFDGVIRTFAIQAGREVRVVVEGSKVTDEQSLLLSRDIARKIEKEMNYPGQVKVTVVRETRAIDYAR